MGTLDLPLSGVVLGHLVEAFDLRRWDTESKLSGRNATRIFGGDERVTPEAEAEIFDGVARAVLASKLFPPVIGLDDVLPPDAADKVSEVPAHLLLGGHIASLASHWDSMVGALERLAPPVALPRLVLGTCLRLVIVDLAVRLTGLLWLVRSNRTEALPVRWAAEGGISNWLKSLMKESKVTRDKLADGARVHQNTADGWLDLDSRPSDENLQDIADVFSRDRPEERESLLRDLRVTYGMRHLNKIVCEVIGPRQATALVERLVRYPLAMLDLPRKSGNHGENDLKMRMALTVGTLGRGPLELTFVESMLDHVCRHEEDPVWRTSTRAVTRSWFDHIGWATTKLPPTILDEFRQHLGELPPVEVQERVAYRTLASKDELTRDPQGREEIRSVIARGGRPASIALMGLARDAADSGDPRRGVALLREALNHDPASAEIHFRLGAWLCQLREANAGLSELEIAVQLDPGWDRAQVEIAIVLLNQGRDDEARRRLEIAKPLLRDPSTWLLLHLAFSYERLGMVQIAVETYEELVRLDPRHGEALDRLAHLRFLLGDKREGARLAREAEHLGFTDVFVAWRSGYYNESERQPRPPRTTPEHLVQLCDTPSTPGKG